MIPQLRATFELLTPSFPLSFEPRDDRMSHERAAIDRRNGRPGTALGVAGGLPGTPVSTAFHLLDLAV